MTAAYLDTHVVVALHDGRVEKLTREAIREIERRDLLISPMVYLELDYLQRGKKYKFTAESVYKRVSEIFDVRMCDFPFAEVAIKAVDCGWTGDPFDRIIVGHAWANGNAPLITADERIREHYPRAIW